MKSPNRQIKEYLFGYLNAVSHFVFKPTSKKQCTIPAIKNTGNGVATGNKKLYKSSPDRTWKQGKPRNFVVTQQLWFLGESQTLQLIPQITSPAEKGEQREQKRGLISFHPQAMGELRRPRRWRMPDAVTPLCHRLQLYVSPTFIANAHSPTQCKGSGFSSLHRVCYFSFCLESTLHNHGNYISLEITFLGEEKTILGLRNYYYYQFTRVWETTKPSLIPPGPSQYDSEHSTEPKILHNRWRNAGALPRTFVSSLSRENTQSGARLL